ncbi:MAG: hypothetical protein PF450_07150 [Bacteroidales bacterium]|jgi:TM2 domain-containing membrane protein YozV|nr:hypothetical protein [Bacteroidales bacterium]
MNNKYVHKKSKTAAVLISVFFGIFGWAYTYKYDAWKFWLSLALTVVSFGIFGLFAYVWVVIDQAVKPSELFEDYYK